MKWLIKCHEPRENVEGFAVFTNEEFVEWAGSIDRLAKVIDSRGKDYEWYVTEHNLTYICSGKDLKNMFTIDPIMDDMAFMLKDYFLQKTSYFGTFLTTARINTGIKEMEEAY